MRISFDIRRFKARSSEPSDATHFDLGPSDNTLSYGAKILVAGNDTTMHNFVQEYVKSTLALTETKNTHIKRNTEVYLIPSGFNSISSFIASRDPLYRQNVF